MNKNNSIISFFKVLFLVVASIFRAQTGVQLQFYNGSPQNYAVEKSGKLYFSGDNLLIKASSTSKHFLITKISKKVLLFQFVLNNFFALKWNKKHLQRPNLSIKIQKETPVKNPET